MIGEDLQKFSGSRVMRTIAIEVHASDLSTDQAIFLQLKLPSTYQPNTPRSVILYRSQLRHLPFRHTCCHHTPFFRQLALPVAEPIPTSGEVHGPQATNWARH
ncbi:hypothetical protein AVEN_213557-1 [Araneus ventricosus]|uniref:Uncharacterized protein n=1 Tax=Araneus ventricosus TaxID=182803 RepID=A0A4Y2JL32_ARAVE|nr:hypothetical protein AVEN_213557-1 [Araneus ventricosus]